MSAPASPEARLRTGFPAGLAELAGRYDGYILDQWGVLHDGTNAYPAARRCLERLRDAGKAVIILSNSGRRGAENEALLAQMGFPRGLYGHVVSAGDDARDALLTSQEPFYRRLGRRCLLLAREGDAHLAAGLGLELTERPEEADFVLILSMDPLRQSVAGWQGLLEKAAARRLPMVCGNPDLYRVHAGGGLYEAPGLVAKAYERLGGEVRYHGKPEPRIYRTCLRLLGLAADRVLAIGDSLEHDVAGADGMGLDSVFIAGGIHSGDIGWPSAASIDAESCARLFEQAGRVPTYALPHFAWDAERA